MSNLIKLFSEINLNDFDQLNDEAVDTLARLLWIMTSRLEKIQQNRGGEVLDRRKHFRISGENIKIRIGKAISIIIFLLLATTATAETYKCCYYHGYVCKGYRGEILKCLDIEFDNTAICGKIPYEREYGIRGFMIPYPIGFLESKEGKKLFRYKCK